MADTRKSKFIEQQIIGILKQSTACVAAAENCRTAASSCRGRPFCSSGLEPPPFHSHAMPKIDISAIPVIIGTGYPAPFNENSSGRVRRRLGDAGRLTDFGVNLMSLPPGKWSSQRHWHSHEDEFVYVIQGELLLVEDKQETVLRAGDCAAFPKGSGNGHHLRNGSEGVALYLEVGSRHPDDLTTCSDVDMMSSNRDGLFVHKDGTPYA